jgi:hypothetical protein
MAQKEPKLWSSGSFQQTHVDLRVCENIPVGRVMGKERMEPAELPG